MAPLLRETLDLLTAPGTLFERDNDRIRCVACAHRCLLRSGQRGICQVRHFSEGILHVPWGYVGALQVDPIEKKPFFHVLPGSCALSFGMLGCDYHCDYCQNWFTSQALRDPRSIPDAKKMSAEDLVEAARLAYAKTVISTYNEPLITSEWAKHVFSRAKQRGFKTGYVSNGNATPQVLDFIRPVTDLYKIDLKSFRAKSYASLGGNLQAVLDSIKRVYEMGFWLEIVTLAIPGFNDSDAELNELTSFIASISPLIPWHVTAFHQDYRMTDPDNTSSEILLRAASCAKHAGLKYIYAGNLPGNVENLENTYCHACNQLLVERRGYVVRANFLQSGACPKCSVKIPGIWN